MVLALVLLLSADKTLLEGLQSDDSRVRIRAAYALARTHEAGDFARLERILAEGESAQRVEVVRGLLCRSWDLSAEIESRLVKLLADRDPRVREAVIDGTRCLPKKTAARILLAEEPLADKRAEGTASALRQRILRLGMELDLDEMREPVRREIHKRSEFLFFRKDCTLEACIDDLAALAWLGEDYKWMRAKLDKQGREPNFFEALILLRLDAIAGDASATQILATEAQKTIDGEIRRKVVDWLVGLPPSPREDVMRLLVRSVEDPDLRTRRQAVAALASNPVRHPEASRDGLTRARRDADPDVRLEAAVGLFDLGEPFAP